MSDRKWTSGYVRRRFRAEVREILKVEDKPPDVKPTHSWLVDHGFSGIRNYAEREGKTVDEVLLEECGFESRGRKPLPGSHAETNELVRDFLEKEEEVFSRLDNPDSMSNTWTYMRKLQEVCRDALGSSNLLRPARAPKGKNVRLTLKIFQELNRQYPSEGSRSNLAYALIAFYDYWKMMGEVDSNPAKQLLPRMGWEYNRESPELKLTPAQVRECWEVTETLEEKILVLSLAGSGLRTKGPLIINAQEDIILDETDPRICLDDDRKNGPGVVPIMAGVDYFDLYIEELAEDGYEMLFPSDQSEDGTRSTTWVRNQIENIVDRADVQLPDGSKPTPKNFRQFWYNEFYDAQEAYLAKVEFVADAQASASPDIVDKHYLTEHRKRDHFRKFAHEHFATAFPSDVVLSPEEIEEARAAERDDEDEDDQTSLGEFVGVWLPGTGPARISALLAKARIEREKDGLAYDDRAAFPSWREALVLVGGILMAATMIGVSTALHGINPLANPGSVPPEMPIALVLWLVYAIYNLPDLEEPPNATPAHPMVRTIKKRLASMRGVFR
ncbi:hypothetical protein [Halorussus marinus]|uniref:hypothetical protein n=1 Tax=Halorussus marinus TaxID=2505976 RepID=UPI00106E2E3A|nr:hypothetical protein [Halorussus marinus]